MHSYRQAPTHATHLVAARSVLHLDDDYRDTRVGCDASRGRRGGRKSGRRGAKASVHRRRGRSGGGGCRLCAAALHAATRTHTGIAPADASADGTSHGYVEFEQQHINSELLVKWLRKFVDELPGLHEREVKKGERILPLLLYSLPAERPILLDEGRTGRSSVAMPFEDLIIAIQTRPPPAVSADALAKAPSPPTMVLGEQCARYAHCESASESSTRR